MKESHNYVHPKKILRTINRNIPAFTSRLQIPLRAVITALYTYSRGFHEVEDLEAGSINIGGTISYNQLAEALPCAYITARRHCERLRKMGLMTWVARAQCIEFTVCLAAANSELPAIDIGNKFRSSRLLKMWGPGRDGIPEVKRTMRYKDGCCPDCKWDQDKRTHWCLDCYEEMLGEGEGYLGCDWGRDGDYWCLTCGDSKGCDCNSTDICERKTEEVAQLVPTGCSVSTREVAHLASGGCSPE